MKPYNTYDIGDTIVLEGKTTDDFDEPVPPVNPKILLKHQDGEELSLEVELSDVVGTWGHQLYLDGPSGFYFYRILTATDAIPGTFFLNPSPFTEPLG